MSEHELFVFIYGALVGLALVGALFFARYWRLTGDRFFGFLAAAFVGFAVNWGILASLSPTAEYREYIYLIRLGSFIAIIAGIIDKNRRAT